MWKGTNVVFICVHIGPGGGGGEEYGYQVIRGLALLILFFLAHNACSVR